MTQPDLTTGRFYLRPPRPEDAEDIAAACSAPGFTRWTRLPQDYRLEHAERFIARENPLKPSWMVLDAVTGRVQGWVGLFFEEGVANRAEVGYWTAPWAAGQGVATEALAALTRYGFGALGLGRIDLVHAVDNPASCTVARRVGYGVVEVKREAFERDGKLYDAELHARLSTDPDPAFRQD